MDEEIYTPEQQEQLVDIIHKGGYVNFDQSNDLLHVWQDLMELSDRELTLMLAGFTGLTNEELESSATLYFPVPKKNLLNLLEDCLVNELTGYGFEETTSFTIGYKDGTVKYYCEVDCDFTPKQPLTSNQSSSTQYKIVRSSLNIRNIDFIIMTDGYEEPTYFATKEGLPALKKYGGFEEWHNGRGEKQRDYIQDDWI